MGSSVLSLLFVLGIAAFFIEADSLYFNDYRTNKNTRTSGLSDGSSRNDDFEDDEQSGDSSGEGSTYDDDDSDDSYEDTTDGYSGDSEYSEEISAEDDDTRPDVAEHENWHLLNNHGHCGRAHRSTSDKIMGGHNADLAEYPWVARLIYRKKDDSEKGACAGSVINNRYVLTSAHCCPDDDAEPLAIVRLGEFDIHYPNDCFRGRCAPPPADYGVEEMVKHHNFNPSSMRNDICLLRLSEEIKFNDYVQPICLPTSVEMMNKNFVRTNLTVVGWGQTLSVPEERTPDILQEVSLRVTYGLSCLLWDSESFHSGTMICAGNVGRSSCTGDSGGPLMYADTDDDDDEGPPRQYILGVVSFGLPCSNENGKFISGEYTKVCKFITWILDTIYE